MRQFLPKQSKDSQAGNTKTRLESSWIAYRLQRNNMTPKRERLKNASISKLQKAGMNATL